MTATPKQTRQSITGPRKLDRGQQGFFYACNFPNPAVLTAELIGEQGAQTLPVLRAAPDPAHPLGSAQGVVVWNIVCNQASGDYTLTIRDQGGHSEDYTFEVRSPNPTTHAEPERILVIPAVGLPGTTFEVYYCGYEERVGRLVEIDFFHFVAVEGDKQIFHRAAGWSVVIDSTGWSRQEIVSVPGDPARPYALRDRETGLSGSSRFWLAP